MDGDKKIIYFLVAVMIVLATILLIQIKTTPKYDPQVYAKIYDEYNDIFGEDENLNMQNIQGNNNIIGNKITSIGNNITQSNKEQGNVIGKIIIPKIEINYPIIKETTEEYLKVAPTRYCGPEVHGIRKFSYSRSQL